MKLIIDISEELYRQVKDPSVEGGYIATECYNAIYRGIPLDRFLEAYNYRDKEQKKPCDNAISRKAAIEAFQIFREYNSNRSSGEWVDRIETVLDQLPPINPQPCEDAISREDALMCLTGEIKEADTIETIIARSGRRIRKLPPVNPQNCDKCEVGNPCLYCRHEFEPQESEEV